MQSLNNRKGMFSLHLPNKSAIYSSYMPFIKNGGLFVPTKVQCSMGEEVFLLLSLLDSKEKIPISGKVIWISPSSKYERTRPAGIGIQFNALDQGATKAKFERLLAGALASDRPTYTL